MGILGWMYREGFGVEKDLDEAKHCFEMEKNVEPFDGMRKKLEPGVISNRAGKPVWGAS